MKPLAALPLSVLVLLLPGCQKGDDKPVAQPQSTTSAAASSPAAVSAAGSGTPSTDPCSLLTASMATSALGVPVGPATTTPLPGSSTCFYKPADGSPNVYVLLTTYAAHGKAALQTATKEFPDAAAIADLGDAALISRRGHAIGVAAGNLLFAISLLRPDGLNDTPAAVESQLVGLARTVLRSR